MLQLVCRYYENNHHELEGNYGFKMYVTFCNQGGGGMLLCNRW